MTERTFRVDEWIGAEWRVIAEGVQLGDAEAMWRCAGHRRRLRIR